MNGEVLWHLNDVTGILWHSNSVMLANLAMQLLRMPPEDFAREIVKDAQYHTIQLMFCTMKFTVSQLIHLGETMAKRKHSVTKSLQVVSRGNLQTRWDANLHCKLHEESLQYHVEISQSLHGSKGNKDLQYIPLELFFQEFSSPHLVLTIISVPKLPISLGQMPTTGNAFPSLAVSCP
jgi:hypothetical protein